MFPISARRTGKTAALLSHKCHVRRSVKRTALLVTCCYALLGSQPLSTPCSASLSAASGWYGETLKRLMEATTRNIEQQQLPPVTVVDKKHDSGRAVLKAAAADWATADANIEQEDTIAQVSEIAQQLASAAVRLSPVTSADHNVNGRQQQNNYLLRLFERTQQPLAASSDAGSPVGAASNNKAPCAFCCQKRIHSMLGVVRTDENGRRCWSPQAFIRVAACSGACQSLEFSSPMPSSAIIIGGHIGRMQQHMGPSSSRTCQPSQSEIIRLELICEDDASEDIRHYQYEQALECECAACAKSKRSVACEGVVAFDQMMAMHDE